MSGAGRGAPGLAMAGVCSALLCLLRSVPAQAQGEGARAYELGPAGSQLVSVYGSFTRGNASLDPGSVAPGLEVDVNGSIIEYSRGFALEGNAGTVVISLPLGDARWRVENAGASYSYTRSGTGDLQLTAVFGVVGSPALQEKDYEAYHPGVALSVLSRVYVPTGAYERAAPVNLGQNRSALQLGLPLAWYLGHSFLDPTLASFELLPSVTWYGDNSEPHVGTRVSQEPLAQLEAHVTRNLNSSLRVSLDGLLVQGGETTTDGVRDHNRQHSVALGATVSAAVSDAVSATLSYSDAVSRNNSGVSGHALRIVAEFSF
jgi:hypothetical protein